MTPDAAYQLLTLLRNPQNKIRLLTLINLSPPAVLALSPILRNPQSKLTTLRLRNLSPEAVREALPALRDPLSKLTALGLSELLPEAVREALPTLPQSRITELIVENLSSEALEALTALSQRNFKIHKIVLINLSPEAILLLTNSLWQVQALRIQKISITILNPHSEDLRNIIQTFNQLHSGPLSLPPKSIIAPKQQKQPIRPKRPPMTSPTHNQQQQAQQSMATRSRSGSRPQTKLPKDVSIPPKHTEVKRKGADPDSNAKKQKLAEPEQQ